MEPFYFGRPEKALFGIYHPPASGKDRDAGVIICHPLGQEYIRSHRALMRLSLLLSSAGFHVLRFDFYGCGDSLGDEIDWDLARWQEDVASAIEELRDGSGAGSICLVGLRLGGSVAMMAGAAREDIDGLVLWDPILDGGKYLDEITELHRTWLRGSFAKDRNPLNADGRIEVMGFPLTESFTQRVREMDLHSLPRMPGRAVLFIDSLEETGSKKMRESLAKLGAKMQHEFLPAPAVWEKKEDDVSKGLVPVQTLQCVVDWICEALA